MIAIIEKIKIFFMIKIIWPLFPHKKLNTIRLFEATEDDSAWQLLYGLKQLEDPSQQAELFEQALEEAHHAELFRKLYHEETKSSLYKISYEKSALYKEKKDAWKLFVYCLIGEESAAERFDRIAKVLPKGPMKKTLEGIVADEIGHIHKAKELLQFQDKTNQEVEKELKSIKRKRFVESWLRSGRQITTFIIDILLGLIYFLITPFFTIFVGSGASK